MNTETKTNDRGTNEPILSVKGLKTYFKTDEGLVKAVDGVDFDLYPGETLGIVGESGSGKSVTNLSIMKLIPSPPGKIAGGQVLFEGKDLLTATDEELRKIRGNKISMIFQDPMTSLNPFLRISTQLVETIRLHQGLGKEEAREKAIKVLEMVGIPAARKRVDSYPHQFSGGMRQRVMIAMALSCNPQILIADEPTTALDVTIQAQILEIIKDLAKEFHTAVIMITHDLGVVAGMCDKVAVMYAGKVVEKASTQELFDNPQHPYTKGLIKSVPRLDQEMKEKLYSIEGQPPSVIDLPDACPFAPRCEFAMDVCRKKYPTTTVRNGREVACWLYADEAQKAEVLEKEGARG
ncbi:peptide ABC transporter ATP-binding protein [Spirochaeta lutea]|uniref:Peptide ABC transporter ATP-binding protein n=2 Tax=Spirochaeta lutea TaxID=1480694 RepID=A0A098QWP8_9SPIO|nr:peptide ABC transporter ATP-binding protein [Spirochaeta lutea]